MDSTCEWSPEEWQKVAALADLPAAPPPDKSNKYVGVAAAEVLGQKLFHDTRFSGTATLLDQLRRPVPYARAAKGQQAPVSCATCHDPNRGGVDVTSHPGHISIGTGWFDVNAQPTINSAYYTLLFWNGRSDSLWAQALAACEGGVSMNGDRLHTVWTISDLYRNEYQAVFGAAPPMSGKAADVQPLLETEGARAGQCKMTTTCPTEQGCRAVTSDAPATSTGCWPRFPLHGKKGNKAGCQSGDPTEPFGDAFDCMAKEDQEPVMRTFVNFGKALAAYEARLISRDAPFDQFVLERKDGRVSTAISPAAKRGAKLFVGKAACSECHNTPLFSDNQFHNIGTPQVGEAVPVESECVAGAVCDCVEMPDATPPKEAKNCLPWGLRDGLAKLKTNPYLRSSVWSDDMSDNSRQALVQQLESKSARLTKGAWRTPTLRDVALTAPYMHDGYFRTLDEVVGHYNNGGSGQSVGVAAAQLRPLFLSQQEQTDIVEFLKTLTGTGVPLELRTPPVLP